MTIRYATMQDLKAISDIESTCFPPEEAASEQSFAQRLAAFPNHFWLLEDNGKILGFIDGLVTSEPTIRDEMFANAAFHDESGAWQTIMGVNTLPEYRRNGFAKQLMERAIADARTQGRKGCVLTCKEKLIHYYAKFGYVNEGVSASEHGGALWYDMRLTF